MSGFKVSLEGYDVNTAVPEQMAFSTDYPPPLIEEDMVGISEYLFDTDLTASSTRNLLTVPHNYGYMPKSVCMVTNGQIWDGSTYTIPTPFYIGFTSFIIRSYTDDANFYVDMINNNAFDVVADNVTYTLKYYIFVDEAL